MNKYRGKKPRLVKRGIGKLRTKSISISPKMKIDNSNLEHATRQFFEKVALTSKKINNTTLKNGISLEKLEIYFKDFLSNGKKYADEDGLCPCINTPYEVYGRCITIPGVPPIQLPVCIIYNEEALELRWINF